MMPTGLPCDQLSALLKNDPNAEDRAAIAAHIANCPVCQQIAANPSPTVDLRNAQTATDLPWKLLDATVDFNADRLQIQSGSSASPGVQVPGYQVLSELGRGGMGVVYKARQVSLDRLVALKMVRSAALADENQLARFNTEAAALAQLQHPNIVQIFAIGHHADMPYLSMEFVAGETLAAAIERNRLTPHQSAVLVEKLARAMFSAHQRGVLHRDLKPANILLAADGEPKITDFGLAKRVGNDSHMTVDHTVMGTPSYMPPEQAQGQISEIGPRSDVYSLGAILYELLTGRPPFRGATPLETIQQVIQREPVAPRTINKRIPRDLETICLKCLHKQPTHRFETAADLADDLRRFQRDEPILARRTGLVNRGWRWCRRNPALSSAISFTLLAMVIGIGGILWQSRETQRARTQAQEQFQRDSAEKLGLIQDLMERVPEPELAQNERLQTALESYATWLNQQPAADAAKASYADALFRVAEIRRRIGQFKLAEAMYLKARDHYESLIASVPENADYVHQLAETLNWLGENYRENGELEKAIAAYEQSMQPLARLIKLSPSEPVYDAKFARSLYNRALAYRALNLAQEAEDDLQQSIERLQRSLKEHPQDATLRQGLARSQINLGVLLDETNRLKAANDEYLKAIGLLTELEKRYPKNVEYRFELATLLMNRANLLLKESSGSELGMKDTLVVAEESYRLSVEKLRVLSAQFSNVPRYRNELANSLNGLGVVQLQLGNKEQAKVAWTEAMTELQSLVARSPNVAVYRYQLALTANNLAYLHRRAADVTELEMRRVSVEQQRKATDLSPTNTLYSKKLFDFENIFARVLLENGKHTDAATVAEELAGRSGDDSATVYAAAKILAQCAVVAAKDTQLTDTQIKEQTIRYRSKATSLLADCQKKGLPVKPEDFPGLDWK